MFRTELPIAPATSPLPRTARVLTMGSCFADSIGTHLTLNKVETLVNPFGTVFQPLALGRLLRAAAGEDVDWQQHLVEARGRWQSYDLHGRIGAETPVELLQLIQGLVQRAGDFLRTTDVVLLTLGTAWAYRLRETGELVSNCHKQPAELFERELLTPDDIINGLAETHAYLRRLNPGLRFVLTVSPVRHLKDTLPLNAVSKSVLRLATHFVSDLLPGVAYFPAFELLTDDLRDYRFYADDMLHPSTVAEEYIWDKFARTYFDADFGQFRKEWAAVRQALEHRPLHAGAPEHRQFLENTQAKLEQLSLRKLDVEAELGAVRLWMAALPAPRQLEPVAAPEDDEERIDIGQGANETPSRRLVDQQTVDPMADQPAATDNRPPRLSPEDFRAQRAARSGRPERGRKGRGPGQPASEPAAEQASAAATGGAYEPINDASQSFVARRPVGLPQETTDESDQDQPKKKKRRSRGGAKRTARKNALRLAGDDGNLPSAAADDSGAGADAAAATQAPAHEGNKSSAVTKSVPVKRRGGRQETARGPAMEESAKTAAEKGLTVPTALPQGGAIEPGQPTAPINEGTSAGSGQASAARGRNRSKRGRGTTAPADGRNEASTPPAVDQLPTRDAAGSTAKAKSLNALQPAIAPRGSRDKPATGPTQPTNAPPAVLAGADATPASARKPARNRSRAVSGARTEKPAIDVPIIPVQADRPPAAAGRMTGSNASLVAPSALPKKATAAKKAPTAKAPAVSVGATAKVSIPKKAAVPKKKAKPGAAAAPENPTPPVPKAPAKLKPKAPAKPKPEKAAAKSKAPKKPAKPA